MTIVTIQPSRLLMDFKTRFKNTPARERDGSRAANRFAFQLDWAICELLRLHDTEENYCVLFETHDDVMVLDCSENPTKIHFYQIKTKEDGNWSWNEITYRKKLEKGLGLSISAKMIDNGVKFEIECESLNFVSNARYKFDVSELPSSLSRPKICVTDLSPSIQQALKENSRHELKLDQDYDFNDKIFFHVTDLNINGHSIYVKGKICDFIQAKIPNTKFRVDPFYQTLYGEVRRKNDLEITEQDFDVLVPLKAIHRKDFEQILNSTIAAPDSKEMWHDIRQSLIGESVPLTKLQKLRLAWNEYELHRYDSNNLIIQHLRKEIFELVKTCNDDDNLTLTELMDKAKKLVQDNEMFSKNQLRKYYAEAMVLREFAEYNE